MINQKEIFVIGMESIEEGHKAEPIKEIPEDIINFFTFNKRLANGIMCDKRSPPVKLFGQLGNSGKPVKLVIFMPNITLQEDAEDTNEKDE